MLDGMSTETRTTEQSEASRQNGTKSKGPVTPAGKLASSGNSIGHGLESRAALMPGESLEAYRANLDIWTTTLGPRTPGEAQVVARIADISFRRDRLSRLEEKLMASALEKALAVSAPAQTLKKVSQAQEAVGGLLLLAEGTAGPVDAADIAPLLPTMRFVVKLLDEAEMPVRVGVALDRAIDGLLSADSGSVGPAALTRLAETVQEVSDGLGARMTGAQQALEAERERLVETGVLADGAETVLLERHRARLGRALEAELRALKLVRELAVVGAGSPGSFVQPLLVEVRILRDRRAAA
jgi:hypothetical protein